MKKIRAGPQVYSYLASAHMKICWPFLLYFLALFKFIPLRSDSEKETITFLCVENIQNIVLSACDEKKKYFIIIYLRVITLQRYWDMLKSRRLRNRSRKYLINKFGVRSSRNKGYRSDLNACIDHIILSNLVMIVPPIPLFWFHMIGKFKDLYKWKINFMCWLKNWISKKD